MMPSSSSFSIDALLFFIFFARWWCVPRKWSTLDFCPPFFVVSFFLSSLLFLRFDRLEDITTSSFAIKRRTSLMEAEDGKPTFFCARHFVWEETFSLGGIDRMIFLHKKRHHSFSSAAFQELSRLSFDTTRVPIPKTHSKKWCYYFNSFSNFFISTLLTSSRSFGAAVVHTYNSRVREYLNICTLTRFV